MKKEMKQNQQMNQSQFNIGHRCSSSSASVVKPSQQETRDRNVLNSASKSVLLKLDDTHSERQDHSLLSRNIGKNTEKKQEPVREYESREQIKQRTLIRMTRNPPQQIPQVVQQPIIQESNNFIQDNDFEYAKQLQEELFLEEFNQLSMNDVNSIPHHNFNHDVSLQHQSQPFTDQQIENNAFEENIDSYERNLEMFQDVVVPLKIEIWNQLPTSQIISGEECSICYSDVCRGQRSTTLPCKHFFHTECIGKWFERKHTCPVCRYDLQ